MRLICALLSAILPACAMAEPWVPLPGTEIGAAFAARTLVMPGNGTTFEFRADGRLDTERDGLREAGHWRVAGDRVCVRLGFDDEICAMVERDRIDLRLTGDEGDQVMLRYIDL